MNDTELMDLLPFLEQLAKVDNVYSLLRNSNVPSPPPPAAPSSLISNGNNSFGISLMSGNVGGGTDVIGGDTVRLNDRNTLR